MEIDIKGHNVLIDDEDYDRVSMYKWFCNNKISIKCNHYYYRNRRIGYLHRFIMNCPQDMYVDHINGDTNDNRKSNLRICTNSQNNINKTKRKDNKTGYKGVIFINGKWRAGINITNPKRRFLFIGNYNCPTKAWIEYCKKLYELYGEYAKF